MLIFDIFPGLKTENQKIQIKPLPDLQTELIATHTPHKPSV